MTIRDSPGPATGRLAKVVLVVALALLPITFARLGRAAARQDVDPPSEVWTALAFDWNGGEPYRPLWSEHGYGGSRYFPGHVAAQAAAMRLLPPVASGFAVTALALVLLLAGGYALLRQLGLPRLASAGGASLVRLSTAIQEAAVATRGDLLSAGLAVCGLVAAGAASRQPPPSSARLFAAALLHALSWFTKFTAVAAPAAAVLTLWGSGRRRAAAVLAGATAALAALLVAWTELKTDGRFLHVLAASASGRNRWTDALKLPYHLLSNARTMMALTVPPSLLAIGCAFEPEARRQFRPLLAYAATALVVALGVHMGYGIEHNHLIELEVASALLLASLLATGVVRQQLGAVVLAACVLLVGTLLVAPDLGLLRRRVTPIRRARYEEILPLVREAGGPILSAYPLVPILAGQRPFLLDQWMFGVSALRRPEMIADLQSRLGRRYFGSVVLTASPSTAEGRREIDRWLGAGTGEAVNASYAPVWSGQELYVLVRRGRGPATTPRGDPPPGGDRAR
jgi:hypothetical protein